jgi:hypothetical protein
MQLPISYWIKNPAIKAEAPRLLTEAGQPPKVMTAAILVGTERAVQLFESAYDKHAHRLAALYSPVGKYLKNEAMNIL